MEILKAILMAIGSILFAVGIVLVLNSMKIVTKRFSNGNKNEKVKRLKIIGSVIIVIGLVLVFFNFV